MFSKSTHEITPAIVETEGVSSGSCFFVDPEPLLLDDAVISVYPQ